MVIIVTSTSQSWDRIREAARRRVLEIGSASARGLETPPHLLPREQTEWAEQNIVASPAFASVHGGYLLVATTYELVVLRCLRRIRERYIIESPTSQRHFEVPEFSVMCLVDRERLGAPYQMLRASREGEFMDRWPEGFFEERIEELF